MHILSDSDKSLSFSSRPDYSLIHTPDIGPTPLADRSNKIANSFDFNDSMEKPVSKFESRQLAWIDSDGKNAPLTHTTSVENEAPNKP